MMLHEAVMLEIYRQALNASELASPRCHSRESVTSTTAGDNRCPSNESHCSGNESISTPAATPSTNSPPVGLPLQATLAPAAAAALLPPQSAAMAAYLNAAAAAAAQQNHLLLANPLAAAATLVQQATHSHSPNTNSLLINQALTSPALSDGGDASALDFSTKGTRRGSGNSASDDEETDETKQNNVAAHAAGNGDLVDDELDGDANSPLDLSVSSGRKRQCDSAEECVASTQHKLKRINDYTNNTWVPPINPYLAAVAAAAMSPKSTLSLDWNASKQKVSPNEATKALEKMTEMTRLGASTQKEILPPSLRHSANANNHSGNNNNNNNVSNGRHSAWQSHWLNKGADAVKDVFKCVWCKQSFPTLASLTTHMKETQHCGVNGAANVPISPSGGNGGSVGNQTMPSATHHTSRHAAHNSSPAIAATSTPTACSSASSATSSSSSLSSASSVSASASTATTTATTSHKSDLNLLIKETMPLPRKLVRGQDVWLGKGAEQTRQILKCMWCGQSFRSLAEMTSHMQETQHYTNIISQEQIISWKTSDDKSATATPNATGSALIGSPQAGNAPTTSNNNTNHNNSNNNNNNSNSNMLQSQQSLNNHLNNVSTHATVSAVLTCKVCDQAFSTLKELSNHMVKNNHYKEHMLRTAASEGAAGAAAMVTRRGRQTREKRKKSLPVRKLLELERAQQDFKHAGHHHHNNNSAHNNSLDSALKPLRDFAASTKITCEKCGDKIETVVFVDHIRQCLGGSILIPQRSTAHQIKPPSYNLPPLHAERGHSPRSQVSHNASASPTAVTRSDLLYALPPLKENEKGATSNAPSVLNAIEQLIEKSFDTRPRPGSTLSGGGAASHMSTPLGASILKRLGIDDTVDYTKPLMDSPTMHFLRSYSAGYAGRDRSASESSSVSERCSSRMESITPERSFELSRQTTPRLTPDKTSLPPPAHSNELAAFKVKSEPSDANETTATKGEFLSSDVPHKIYVKKEFSMTDDAEMPLKKTPANTPTIATEHSRAISPSNQSDRSNTPKSNKSPASSSIGSSLNALSSMFDSLNSIKATNHHNNNNNHSETNNNNTSASNAGMHKKSNANPLAALQKLCETTDTPAGNTRSNSTGILSTNNNNNNNASTHTNGGGGNSGTAGSMVAFSWACNDAVMTAADSIIKCSYCDTPFCSKGAYRHHLSKVHFVKDDADSSQCSSSTTIKSPPSVVASPKSTTASPRSTSKSPAAQQRQAMTSPATLSLAATPTINPYDESAQSKFLKYTELAKQLSSKNV